MTAWLPIVMQRNVGRITDRSGMPARSDGEMTGSRYQFYETADGRVALFGCIEQRFWRQLGGRRRSRGSGRA